ncbi:MAG: hypothetical protein JWO98_3695 [Frankiales bacterium]|nr:hypothetical protein [Frankiales bacterium]
MWPGEWGERFARWGLVVVAGGVAVYAVPVLTLGTLTVGWFVTALVISRPARTADDEPDAEAVEAGEDELVPLHPDDLADIVSELGHGTGVLLSTLRGHLAAELPDRPWTTATVRELLADAGIRVRDGVRVPGVGNAAGVHRDDVPQPLSPAPDGPSPAVVVPGQRDNNNNDNTIVERYESGMTIVRNPAEARRYAVTEPIRRTS